jgi:hypothetical protein
MNFNEEFFSGSSKVGAEIVSSYMEGVLVFDLSSSYCIFSDSFVSSSYQKIKLK